VSVCTSWSHVALCCIACNRCMLCKPGRLLCDSWSSDSQGECTCASWGAQGKVQPEQALQACTACSLQLQTGKMSVHFVAVAFHASTSIHAAVVTTHWLHHPQLICLKHHGHQHHMRLPCTQCAVYCKHFCYTAQVSHSCSVKEAAICPPRIQQLCALAACMRSATFSSLHPPSST
jgi:hypothetical protein